MSFTEDGSEKVFFGIESPAQRVNQEMAAMRAAVAGQIDDRRDELDEAVRLSQLSSMPRRFYRRSHLIPRKDFHPEEVARVVAEDIEKFYGDEPAPLPDGVVPAAGEEEELEASGLRKLLTEAIQLRQTNPSAAITTEKRVNAVLHALAAYLDDEATGHNIRREGDHGYWFTELAKELRDMIEWSEFLADETAQEGVRQSRSMDWMKL